MKKLLLPLVLLFLVTTISCGSSTSQNTHAVQLRVMQGSVDIGSVDVLLDSQVIASNLAFHAVVPTPTTNYLSVRAGKGHFQVFPAGATSPVFADLTQPLSGNKFYTALTVGRQSSGTLSTLILTDDHSAPAAGQVKFRLVQGASSIGALDVYLTNQPTDPVPAAPAISGFSYKSVTSYISRMDRVLRFV